MNVLVKFGCQFCKKEFTSGDKCFIHELEHLNITKDEYDEWRVLHMQVRYSVVYTNFDKDNEKKRNEFENAVERLNKFEETHNISGVHIDCLSSSKFIID